MTSRKPDAKRIAELYALSGLPPRARASRLDQFQPHQADQHIIEYLTQYTPEPGGVVLCGITRVGKSHLVAGLANRLIEDGVVVRYVKSVDLVCELFRRFPDEREAGIQKLTNPKDTPLLIIDDIGVEKGAILQGADKGNDWIRATLLRIIDNRIDNLVPTVFTTNYPLIEDPLHKEMKLASSLELVREQLGDRIVERLREFRVFVVHAREQ